MDFGFLWEDTWYAESFNSSFG